MMKRRGIDVFVARLGVVDALSLLEGLAEERLQSLPHYPPLELVAQDVLDSREATERIHDHMLLHQDQNGCEGDADDAGRGSLEEVPRHRKVLLWSYAEVV